jgi:hypothetical protein
MVIGSDACDYVNVRMGRKRKKKSTREGNGSGKVVGVCR